MTNMLDDAMIQVSGLKKYFPIEKGFFRKVVGEVKAVDDVSFVVRTGETFGLVGESGCGKTTTARLIPRALEPTDGTILFRSSEGPVDMLALDKNQLREARKNIQMIFQDPYSSLNPRMPILDIIAEPLMAHGKRRSDCEDRVAELLNVVGLDPSYMRRYPHAFSGGQRQRIGIARALSLEPSLIIADEPVSALDVSVQAQILNLLIELQRRMGLTYVFISHDLGVIRYICDRVAVMYMGKIVEMADTESLFYNPLHPYTSALLAAVPEANPDSRWLYETIAGEVSDTGTEITGCSFAPRCKYVEDICIDEVPTMVAGETDGNHEVACHLAAQLQLSGVV